MRVDLKTLLDKLGVKRELNPYETQPWLHYDDEQGITCSAEVRMGPGNVDLEAEIQFLRDETDESEDTEGEGESEAPPPREQIMRMRAEPVGDDGKWSPKYLVVKSENYAGEVSEWEEKGCNFFKGAIAAIQMGELPDIDELIEKELSDGSGFGGGKKGKIGRKSPKVKPGALLGMKKPGGGM